MCFIYDGAWHADVCEKFPFEVVTLGKCDECQRDIPSGRRMFHIYLQEHEDCQNCFGYDAPEDKEDCDCAEPEFGETFQCCQCEDCVKLIQAIMAVEAEEGCKPSESAPGYKALFEELCQIDDSQKYVDKAKEMFPELVASGYIQWVENKLDHNK